jgi:hypothetical protein
MNESAQTNSLIDTLLGRDVETDHGGLTLGDVIVLLLDLVLLIYTGWRSYDFLTTSVPKGYEILALVGLWGLDIGAVAWSLVWIFGSASKYQDWVSMFFFVFDLVGVVLTSLTDSLLYGQADGVLSVMLKNVAMLVVPLIVVANVVAGFIYHLTSPQTRERRAKRKAEHEYRVKMMQIRNMERDLAYAEAYLLARQEILDKSAAMAKIKMLQDQIERQTRMALRDLTGIHGLTTPQDIETAGQENLSALQKKIEELKRKLPAEPVPVTASGNGHGPQGGAGGAAADPLGYFPEE